MASPELIAHQLVAARLSSHHITELSALPPVETLDQAYEVQAAMLKIDSALGPHCGWKAGATNPGARKTLGLEEPFPGPLFASALISTPAALSKDALNLNLLEPEFGFKLCADLPAKPTIEEAWAATESVTLVIEACGTRCK
eukprot:SAG11_NODE_6487_length_1304_cov_1.034855_2_plen_142_part_00